MNTEQNYVGRGSHASPTRQPAKNAAKSSPSPDKRQPVHPNVYEAQTRLLNLVDNFVAIGFASGPVEAVNNLLIRWVTTPQADLNQEDYRNQLRMAFQLVTFLTELYEASAYLDHTVERTGEVSHE